MEDRPMPTASSYQLNGFERILFRVAVVLALIIVAVRVGAIVALWCAHH
jgi:hypothetical protein